MSQGFVSGTLVAADRKLTGIHGLRAVAALMVIAPHVTLALLSERTLSPRILNFVAITGFGVHLFFVLSAFSLFNSTRPTAEGFVEYGIKRFFRIAPLYYAVMLLQQLRDGPGSVTENIVNVTFVFSLVGGAFRGIVQGGWSVGVEMVFYAVLPLILLLCKTRRDFVILALVGTVISWASYRYVYDANPAAATSIFFGNGAYFSFPVNMITFCYGLLAYAVFRDAKSVNRVAWMAAGVAGLGVALLLALGDRVRTPDRLGEMILFAVFALVTLWQALRPSWLMSNAFMQYIGERSYSTYLVQFPVIYVMQPVYHWLAAAVHWPASVMFLLFYIVTAIPVIAAASVTHRLIEVPGVNTGRAIIRMRRAKQLAAVAAD